MDDLASLRMRVGGERKSLVEVAPLYRNLLQSEIQSQVLSVTCHQEAGPLDMVEVFMSQFDNRVGVAHTMREYKGFQPRG